MLAKITPNHILTIIELVTKVQQEKNRNKKSDLFSKLSAQLSAEEKWLFTLFVWHCKENPCWKPLDPSRFYIVKPSEKNTSSIRGFLSVLNHYKNQNVTLRKEKVFVAFLRSCDEVHFHFYLQVFSRRLMVGLPVQQVLEMIDLASLDTEQIYGDLPLLTTSFSDLKFPVSVTKVTDPETIFFVQGRHERGSIGKWVKHAERLTKVTALNFLRLDARFIKEPSYAIAGFLDQVRVKNRRGTRIGTVVQAKMHPTDYFSSYRGFRDYLAGKPAEKFEDRIQNLNRFLSQNFTPQIEGDYVGFARSPEEVFDEVQKVIRDETVTHIVFSDSESTRNGNWFAVKVVRADGIIHSYWAEGDTVKGFKVWWNGEIENCQFDFSGRNSALLTDPKFVQRKPIDLLCVKIGDTVVLRGLNVKWDRRPWRLQPLSDGTMIEKCCLCGSQEQPHRNSGVCESCDMNLPYFLRTYGPDNWIYPRWKGEAIRNKTGWEPKLLDKCELQFHEFKIDGDGKGGWRFKPDEKAKVRWHEWLRKNGREDEIELERIED